jgi:ubiquitin carboxyl-terminal hydrolase L3
MYKFHDVYALDDDVWSGFIPQPVLAVILLYQIKKQHEDLIAKDQQELTEESPFFVKQKIHNACGTIALLHAVCNTISHVGAFREESFLETFMMLNEKSTPDERADYLNNDQRLEETH